MQSVPTPLPAPSPWSDFYHDFGDAILTVLAPEPGDPAAFLLQDPDGAMHGVTLDEEGRLIVTGPKGDGGGGGGVHARPRSVRKLERNRNCRRVAA